MTPPPDQVALRFSPTDLPARRWLVELVGGERRTANGRGDRLARRGRRPGDVAAGRDRGGLRARRAFSVIGSGPIQGFLVEFSGTVKIVHVTPRAVDAPTPLETYPPGGTLPPDGEAMPVILRTKEEMTRWLTAPTAEALKMQRPLPDGALKVVATGKSSSSAA